MTPILNEVDTHRQGISPRQTPTFDILLLGRALFYGPAGGAQYNYTKGKGKLKLCHVVRHLICRMTTESLTPMHVGDKVTKCN
jgi:hypothetical protein